MYSGAYTFSDTGNVDTGYFHFAIFFRKYSEKKIGFAVYQKKKVAEIKIAVLYTVREYYLRTIDVIVTKSSTGIRPNFFEF